jgi:hypothetical protein
MSTRAYAAVVTLALAAALLVLPASAVSSPAVAPPGVGINYSTLPGLQNGPVPWTADDGDTLRARLDRLDLPVLGAEQLDYHIHVHIDIFVHGVHIPVPALIGINVTEQFLTVLHTHDASGVVHVESASNKDYQLGKFFGVWGVRLNANCIGRYCGSGGTSKLRTWVNGKPYDRNPATITLQPHEEIVLTVGAKADVPHPIAHRFAWPPGL